LNDFHAPDSLRVAKPAPQPSVSGLQAARQRRRLANAAKKRTPVPTILSCSLRAGVPTTALNEWQPTFNIGNPGDPCVFPFTWNGTVYNTCADVERGDKTGVRVFGFCFSDPATLTFGACACTTFTPPPSKPVVPTPKPVRSTLAPTGYPTPKPTIRPSAFPTLKPAPSKHPTSLPTTQSPTIKPPPKCYQVGSGPIPGRSNATQCNLPIRYQATAKSEVVVYDYCIGTLETPPGGLNDPKQSYDANATGYWCPVLGAGAVYQPHLPQIELQWSWCQCDGPPPDVVYCSLKSDENPIALQQWKPNFTLGNPGDPCVFPFTYEGTTYYECAEVNTSASDPVRRTGWCFSDIITQTFGACQCSGTMPPTGKPAIPSLSPTRLHSSTNAPTTGRPVRPPTRSPAMAEPSTSPTYAITPQPSLAPLPVSIEWEIVFVIAPPPALAGTFQAAAPSAASGRALDTAVLPAGVTMDTELGFACLLHFVFFSVYAANAQPVLALEFTNSTVIWPKIVHAYFFVPAVNLLQGNATAEMQDEISSRLRNATNELFVPGLWVGGDIVYSSDDNLDVMYNKSVTGEEMRQFNLVPIPSPTVCNERYLNLTVLSPGAPPASSPDAGSLSPGGVAGVVIAVFACVGLGAAFLLVRSKQPWLLSRTPEKVNDSPTTTALPGTDGGGGGVGPRRYNKTHTSSSRTTLLSFFDPARRLTRPHESSSVAGPLSPPGAVDSPPVVLSPQGVSPVPPSKPQLNEFSIDLSELRLGKVIGQGGNGQIFAAQYAGSAVAVKELFALPGSDSGVTVDVLFREYDNLRVLKHPHIIQIFGLAVARNATTDTPRYLLVMELADTSLDKVLLLKAEERAKGEDTKPWAMEIAKQVASGLAFVHDKGFIHFDVKPHNILLDKSGYVKLCDLGISRLAHGDKSDAPLAGTPSYMAPELIRGDQEAVGPPVDVYAFSIVLWQLFHFASPYPKEWTVARLFDEVLRGHRPTLDDTCMSAPLQNLTLSCWQASPVPRPSFKRVLTELSPLAMSMSSYQPSETEKQLVEAVRYENGDRVRVYSAAVRALVPGTVKIPPEKQTGRKMRFYDVLLHDGSLMVGVNESDLFPPVSTQRSPTHELQTVSSNPLGLNSTSTVADLASALAVERHGGNPREPIKSPTAELAKKSGRRRFLQRLWKLPHQASDSDNESVGPESAVTNTSQASPPSKGKRRARLSMDERVMLGGGRDTPLHDDTRRSLEDTVLSMAEERNTGLGSLSDLDAGEFRATPPHNASSRSMGSPDPMAIAASAAVTAASTVTSAGTVATALPALTPFSFRFLPTKSTQDDAESVPAIEEKSVTFAYDGAKLSLPGMVLSTRSLHATQASLPEELKDADSFRKGSVRIAELGRGASGVVYSALVLSTFQIVAVKEVRFGDRSARHQVVRELNALSRTSSPYIVRMLAAHLDTTAECVALVLEYINGGSLQDFINFAKGATLLAEPVLTNIAHDVTCALAYIHDEMNIVHLDVKPSNILLSLDGTAKLADFGLARQIEINKMAATFVGTTKYLSPERLRGGEYSFSADVWGLGMCLLAAALGKYPFDSALTGRNEQGVYWSLLEKLEKDPLPTLPTDSFSFAARRFCNSCLALDPARRPTANQLMGDAWFEHRTEVAVKKTALTREASILVLGEVCESIVKYLAKSGTTFVNMDPRLVANLAAQVGLSEPEVRLAFRATAERLASGNAQPHGQSGEAAAAGESGAAAADTTAGGGSVVSETSTSGISRGGASMM